MTLLPPLYIIYIDQCRIPWIAVSSEFNVTFEYGISGPRLVYNCLSGLPPTGEIVSVCTSNGSWYPNPAEIVCTQPNDEGLFSVNQLSQCHNFNATAIKGVTDYDNTDATITDSNWQHNQGTKLSTSSILYSSDSFVTVQCHDYLTIVLVHKARHLCGSDLCLVGTGVPDKEMSWFPLYRICIIILLIQMSF